MFKRRFLRSAMVLALFAGTSQAQSLGTAFTYNGQLTEAGQPATGLFDLQLCLFDSLANPVALACAPDFDDVPVADGLFTVTPDFAALPFVGQQRFIELRVRPGASSASYTVLSPRQLIRATPEALRANAASVAPWSGLTGVPTGFADGIDNNSGGTLTAITAGTGLSGGTITSSGTLGIANGGVGMAQIATGAVDGARVLDGSLGAVDVQADSLGAAQIAGNAITAAELADAAVDTAAVQNLAITQAKIAAGAVGTNELQDGGVGLADLANGAVNASKIVTAEVQRRVSSQCSSGAIAAILESGAVVCDSSGAIPRPQGGGTTLTGGSGATSVIVGADGLPFVAAHDAIGGRLLAHHCNDLQCTSRTTTVLDADGVGGYPSVILANGLPWIAYYDAATTSLNLAACSNLACTGAALSVLDNAADVGEFASATMNLIGTPLVLYYDRSNGDLRMLQCGGGAACTTPTSFRVDGASADVGQGASAFTIMGRVYAAYRDVTNQDLKVFSCFPATGGCTGTQISVVDASAGTTSQIAVTPSAGNLLRIFWTRGSDLLATTCANPTCAPPFVSQVLLNAPLRYIAATRDALGYSLVLGLTDVTPPSARFIRCTDPDCGAAITSGGSSFNSFTFDAPPSIALGANGFPVYSTRFGDTATRVTACSNENCFATLVR